MGASSIDPEWVLSASNMGSFAKFALVSYNLDNPMDSTSSGCATDLNGDGYHDTLDMLILLGNYGCVSACPADINGDDLVDTIDLLTLLGVFATPC